MVRTSYKDQAERDDVAAAGDGTVYGDYARHFDILERRRLCMVYIVECSSGELVLWPNTQDESEATAVRIPLTESKLIVFRHDCMEFSYRPEGSSVALQAWVLDAPRDLLDQEKEMRIIRGPQEPEGARVNVMSMMTRFPGCGYDPQAYWNIFVSGTDAMVQIPLSRWDIDVYYRSEHTVGYSMSKHGGFLTQAEIDNFDNEFFGIPAEEAAAMAPLQRVVCEVGYATLARAGHTRDSMKGWNCGVFLGDCGSDWDEFFSTTEPANQSKERLTGRSFSITCGRISHIFGLTGPVSTSETACSSSLVATSVCQLAMRRRNEEDGQSGMTTNLDHGLIVGINTLIGVGSYISLSGPGMLTVRGRCFTFDKSADGYARGEGCGGLHVKYCTSDLQSYGREAMLIGSAVNQDGRSASMTAPHGPSQQDVIRASMRDAGVSPNLTTIAECHGTGTALGDPIEVGALRGVIKKDRTTPFLVTSAKTNLGHLEASAGMAGLIKCIKMLNNCVGAPNCHLRNLNPHLDVAGFPVYFETEPTDFGANSGLTGVSSFGFGGTNARADVWGHASRGPRACSTGTTFMHQEVFY